MTEITDQGRLLLRARAGGFSGVDISAVVRLPPVGSDPVEGGVSYQFGAIQTLSYSVYTAKPDIRSMGFRNVLGYARGGRTIAGTMMFNQLYTHPMDDQGIQSVIDDQTGILSYSSGVDHYHIRHTKSFDIPEEDLPVFGPTPQKRHMYDFTWDQVPWGQRIHPSDMPPFDIILVFVNEVGNVGKMILYGVDLVHESSVLSIEDIYTEVQYQYVARDIEYFYAEDWEEARSWSSRVLLGSMDEVTPDKVKELESNVVQDMTAPDGALPIG